MEENEKTTPAQKTKTAPAKKITVILTGAGSCTLDDITLKKGQTVELEAGRAERFLKSGLFEKA